MYPIPLWVLSLLKFTIKNIVLKIPIQACGAVLRSENMSGINNVHT